METRRKELMKEYKKEMRKLKPGDFILEPGLWINLRILEEILGQEGILESITKDI